MKDYPTMINDNIVVAGIDTGSLTAKTVLLDGSCRILGYKIEPIGASSQKATVTTFTESLNLTGIKVADIDYVVSTGYGRYKVPFSNKQITEITCHAMGAYFLAPETKMIIDIGGQDCKIIHMGERGEVDRFVMNDKCAAGSGRFLEVMARALEIDLEEMGLYSLQSQKELQVSSVCTVFAESEVVSLVAAGEQRVDIIAAIHRAIASRIVGLVARIGLRQPIMISGGVAKNEGMVKALEKSMGVSIRTAEEPQIVGALGAAVLALMNLQKGKFIFPDREQN